jgi:hypothetical protein
MDVIQDPDRRPSGRARLAIGVAATIVVAAVAAALVVGRAPQRPPQSQAPPAPPPALTASAAPASASPASPTPSGPAQNTFVPATTPGPGDQVIMPVTFPDGSTAEIRYPRRLGIAELRVRPAGAARLGEGAERELFAPPRGEAWFATTGAVRLRTLPGASGQQVAVWRGNRAFDFDTEYLVFGFGRWRLVVADDGEPEMLFEERERWAANLRGRETQEGFLVLSGDGPLRLSPPGARDRDEPTGPQLQFGDRGGQEVWFVLDPNCRSDDRPDNMRIGGPRPDDTGSVCRESVLVAAAGDDEFVADVLRQVEVGKIDIRS